MWSSSPLLRPDDELDLEIVALAAGRTPAPGDVSKMIVSLAGNGLDESHQDALLVVGYGIALWEPSLVATNPQLLQDDWIRALMFELLEPQGAKMPEQRYAAIQGAFRASQLSAIGCGASRRRRNY